MQRHAAEIGKAGGNNVTNQHDLLRCSAFHHRADGRSDIDPLAGITVFRHGDEDFRIDLREPVGRPRRAEIR
ncbi:hypothetical protein D3C72_2171220 [compost metagenome]